MSRVGRISAAALATRYRFGDSLRSSKAIQIISCHAEGEVGDVIIGGVTPPPGETLWDQSRFIAQDESLRNLC